MNIRNGLNRAKLTMLLQQYAEREELDPHTSPLELMQLITGTKKPTVAIAQDQIFRELNLYTLRLLAKTGGIVEDLKELSLMEVALISFHYEHGKYYLIF